VEKRHLTISLIGPVELYILENPGKPQLTVILTCHLCHWILATRHYDCRRPPTDAEVDEQASLDSRAALAHLEQFHPEAKP